VNLWETDLDLEDRCAARRQYRTLRLVIYAPQSSGRGEMYQGCYGMSREDAKRFLRQFYLQVSWYTYLGSK
jgi:hypothetical protein